MALTQSCRNIKLTTPLGDDALLLQRMTGSERLGRLYEFQLDLVSEERQRLDVNKLLGESVSITFDMPNDECREFNGIVTRIAHVGERNRQAMYHATVRPWLWLLTRTSDCRIFQKKTAKDIIIEVLSEGEYQSNFEDNLTGQYRQWEYCVQYRETDFNFVSRLMEQEGIYYYFKHKDGQHTMVLCDGISGHETVPGYESVPYFPDSGDRVERDHLNHWSVTHQVQPGAYALNEYDFTKPTQKLQVESTHSYQHTHGAFEIYDYPGEYEKFDEGEHYAKMRLEELTAAHEVAEASGDAAGLHCGCLFSLENTGIKDYHKQYLVTQASYMLESDDFDSGGGSGEDEFSISLSAIDSQTIYRAVRSTPKPLVQGPQTAMVVGPSGEEIHTDEFGRVKLQFHWDRYGKKDENASCWVRVSQLWAGKGWGGIHIPRIGHEVIVEFLEGDPDRPIITGGVYNGDNGVPYGLPGSATQSGIKSRSSKGGGGGNFNEIRMEDKMGSEELYIHAEKNQNNMVENDETTTVGHDRTEKVGNDETISIGNNRKEDVKVDETILIGSNRSVTIGSDKKETIGKNKTETIAMAKTLTIGKGYQATVGGGMNETVAMAKAQQVGGNKSTGVNGNVSESYKKDQTTDVSNNQTLKVGKDQSQTIGKNQTTSVGENQKQSVGKNQEASVGENQTTSVGKDQSITVGKKLTINAGDEITIVTGKASITMKKDGTIQISGKDISVTGKGAINAKADKNIVMKGQKILQN